MTSPPLHQRSGRSVLIGLAMLLWIASGVPVGSQTPEPSGAAMKPRAVQLEEHPWFEVYEILPGVFTIREPGHWERVISYLVVGDERALLFDTGTGIGDIQAVVGELTQRPIMVVNSHSHPDHVGGNHAFETIFGVSGEYAARGAEGRSVADSQRFVPARAFSRKPPSGFSRETYRIQPYRVSRFLKDGEAIDLGGRVLEVLLTPGHSPDSLCLVDRKHRFVVTGDTFYLGRLFVHSAGSSLESYAASARRLADLAGAVDRILPAHSATLLKSSFLPKLNDAFQAITRDATAFEELRDGRREYPFQSFSIITGTDAK